MNPKDYLTDIKGKSYLPVAARVAWLRGVVPEPQPDWTIATELIHYSEQVAVVKATVLNEHGQVVATAHSACTLAASKNLGGRYIEKAETSAVGRALAFAGYGTLQAGEDLDEGDHLSDAPQQPAQDDKETKLILWASRQGLNVDQLDRALGAHPSEFDGTGEDAVALVKAFKARVAKEVPSWVDEKPQRGKFYATLSDMAIEEDEFKQWANAASMREYATLDDALAELNVYVEYKLNEHVSDWNGQD